ncbi:acyl-phosphate glycerol-3-phosphate acyltransferase [Tumebacillus sp. BK434]|uniref:glycerol-3-phosphate 1-O-acyltransferase PlsY n=1 Tax=Tumebacillus sp. BK434 TaxID=2512169 RepID=UPI00104FD9EF|nr:glycerol-3-phosphate 1-O-acyltransferase PlsY [Tumebacillus sp. BK434]TCP55528.1 acyl-phosphate glycerol-3-phosphate acyltransferase [Tumebacillus sp. BK434]
MIVSVVIALLFGYLVGSTPFAFLLGKRKGANIFTEGSGNPGATNTLTLFGKRAAGVVLLLDLLKGFVPTMLTGLVTGDQTLAFWTAAGAVLGHVFSLYTKFRGGKALATAGGALLFLHPVPLLIVVVSYVILLLLIRYIVIATTLVIVGALLVFLFTPQVLSEQIALFAMVTGVLYRHLPNWERIYLKNEPKIGQPVHEVTLERLSLEKQEWVKLSYWITMGMIFLAFIVWKQM